MSHENNFSRNLFGWCNILNEKVFLFVYKTLFSLFQKWFKEIAKGCREGWCSEKLRHFNDAIKSFMLIVSKKLFKKGLLRLVNRQACFNKRAFLSGVNVNAHITQCEIDLSFSSPVSYKYIRLWKRELSCLSTNV